MIYLSIKKYAYFSSEWVYSVIQLQIMQSYKLLNKLL